MLKNECIFGGDIFSRAGEEDNLESELIKHCSPTLANIKTGNIFNYKFKSLELLKNEVECLNVKLNRKGIYIVILNVGERRSLIYAFRKSRLEEDMKSEKINEFLMSEGYKARCWENVPDAIGLLKKRLQLSCRLAGTFPHEIGVFLGYPIEDVKGFIENKGQNCLCCGCWKVYDNKAAAMKQFERFEKCRNIYCRMFQKGKTISQLAVAV